MNFLAHAYLSGDNEKILVGNFIGDFVKGRLRLKDFDTEIVRGIELHRSIDEFTDNHSIVRRSKDRLRPKYKHYAGVIVDVFYDHLLAVRWDQYHHVPLSKFSDTVYKTIQSFNSILPEGIKYMLPFMVSGNWLLNYSTVEGIGRSLTGMSRRTTFDSKMNEAVTDLKNNYELFEIEFHEFFPLLKKHAEEFLSGGLIVKP
jgi:acyl carrier protein phosphodiesterase